MENVQISRDDLDFKEEEFQKIGDISNKLREIQTDLDKGLTEVLSFSVGNFATFYLAECVLHVHGHTLSTDVESSNTSML